MWRQRGLARKAFAQSDVAGGDEETTRKFLIQGWERGIVGLRTLTPFGVGKYLRASLYNGVSMDQVEVLAAFMTDFLKTCRSPHSSASC